MIAIEPGPLDIAALKGYEPSKLVDDGRDWKGVLVAKPWGSEREIYRGVSYSVWRLNLMDGFETSMHCHTKKRAVLLVDEGKIVLETLSSRWILRQGDSALIEAGAFHRSEAQDGPAVVIEIETPSNRYDIVRLFDRYGRVGKGYECA